VNGCSSSAGARGGVLFRCSHLRDEWVDRRGERVEEEMEKPRAPGDPVAHEIVACDPAGVGVDGHMLAELGHRRQALGEDACDVGRP
jgi:hypothetical protein